LNANQGMEIFSHKSLEAGRFSDSIQNIMQLDQIATAYKHAYSLSHIYTIEARHFLQTRQYSDLMGLIDKGDFGGHFGGQALLIGLFCLLKVRGQALLIGLLKVIQY